MPGQARALYRVLSITCADVHSKGCDHTAIFLVYNHLDNSLLCAHFSSVFPMSVSVFALRYDVVVSTSYSSNIQHLDPSAHRTTLRFYAQIPHNLA
jgi:hypothetical protein